MIYDLHCHTTASDGTLSPEALIQLAIERDIDTLAITDHDTIRAHQTLNLNTKHLNLISGIELSTQWRGVNVHIVGLNFQLDSTTMLNAVEQQQQARNERAEIIAEKLEQLGIEAPLAGAKSIAGDSTIGRPHFAEYLVNCGAVNNTKQAFKKYLGAGKPGDVKQLWAPLSQVVEWIRDAGGIAVLAHPAKYKLTNTKLGALCDDFITAGGQGFEVCSGLQLPSVTKHMAQLCEQKNLLASCGSDFHRPNQQWAELGRYSKMPEHCTPVWQHF